MIKQNKEEIRCIVCRELIKKGKEVRAVDNKDVYVCGDECLEIFWD